MDKVKQVYKDSRYTNNGSESNSDLIHLIHLITQPAMLMIYVFLTPGEPSNFKTIKFI